MCRTAGSALVEQALEQVFELVHVHGLDQVREEAGVEAQPAVVFLPVAGHGDQGRR